MAYTGKNALSYLEEEFKKKAQEAAKKAKAEEAKQKSTNVSTGGTTSHKGGKPVKASQSKGSHQTSNPTKTTKKPSYEEHRGFDEGHKYTLKGQAGVSHPDAWDKSGSRSSGRGDDKFGATKRSALSNRNRARNDDSETRTSRTNKTSADIAEANAWSDRRYNRALDDSLTGRISNITHGSAESFAGAQLSSVGTAMQKWKTDEDSILKGEYIGGEKGQKKYSTRRGDRLTESQARRKAEDTSESNGSRRQGVRVGDFERVYESDPNSFSSGLIKAGDTLQTAGSNRIERAKEGLGTVGKLAVDLSSNALMMAGDGLLNLIAPGAGLASLANRSGGMASYEMRQQGFNPDEQYRYALATSAVEVLSEQIGNGVSAFRGIYGKGAIDMADSVATRLGASRIVQDLFKHSKIGRNLVTELARLGVNMTEEGLEEVVADLAEPAMKYLITKDSGGQYDPATLKEMGYDYLIGSLMALAGGGGVDVARNLAMDTSASPAMVDGALSAASRSVMNIGLAQNEGTTANYLANAAQEQINKGGIVTEAQIRHIIDSASKERVSNEESRIEREDELVAEGIRKGEIETSKYENTLARDIEKKGYSEAYVKSIEKAYDQVVEAMGDVDLNDPITSEIADSLTREMVGSANTADIDTILSNSEAKAAYEKLTGETLPLSNTKAREVLETKSLVNAIANNNQNYQMTWSKNAKEIAIAQNSNHGKNGQQVFLENYTKGEEVVGKAAYDDLFNKIYTAGTISDISLNEVVDMVNQTVEGSQAGKEYFTEARINQIFSAGRADTPTVRTVDSVLKKTANKGKKPTKRMGKLTIDESAMGKVTDSQKKALERLAKNGGVEIRIVDHIKNDSNNPEAIINGKYQGGVIYIAADSENPLITVAKHELTHWIKENNPEGYKKLENFVFKKWYHGNQNEMQAAIREYSNLYKGLTIQEVKEEIIADSTEAFFTDDEAVREVIEYDRSLGKTIRNGLRQILKDLAELRQSQTDGLEHGYGDFLKDLNILTEAESLWAEAFGEAAKGTPTKGTVEFSTEAKQQLEELGASVTEGGTVAKNSLTSWKATDIAKLRKMLIEAGYSAKEVNKWIRDVNSVAAVIAADRGRLDYEADAYQDALKPNQEYFYTLDLSTLCAKRRLYQGTYNAIMKRLPNTAMMPEDTIRLRKMMADMKKEVPCGICYEESRKKNEGKFAETWLNGQTDKEWNQKLKDYEKKLKKYEQKLAEYNALENKGKKKPPKPPEKPERWMGYANMEHEDSFIPTLADVTTTTGRKKLRDEGHSEALESYLEYQKGRGSANPKVSFTHTDYRGDILRMTEKDIENVKHIGGLRIQSFSDFETIHVIDMMQALMDMASKKLTAQAYTKVPAFADIFGGTGVKINLSLIGKVVNGKLTFDSKEGIDPKEAFRLRKKYSKNVGTILVGANVESILAAWADPRIDMVIPFHRSGWSTEEFEQLGLGDYEDFQDYQAERYLDGSPNGKSLADAKMQEIYSEDYWDYNKTGKENAEAYLKLCAEKHYRPVFYNFLHDNGDGTWSLQEDGSTDGYWKSLIDYKMYDNDGVGAPQEVVKPIFNMRAANKAMAEFDGDPNTLPIAEDVVDEFVKDYENRHKGTKFSMSKKEDQDYLDAVKAKDWDKVRKMVDEAAEKAGYDIHVYHSTNKDFTVFKGQSDIFNEYFYFSPNKRWTRAFVRETRYTKNKDVKTKDIFLKSKSILDASKEGDKTVPEWFDWFEEHGIKVTDQMRKNRIGAEAPNANTRRVPLWSLIMYDFKKGDEYETDYKSAFISAGYDGLHFPDTIRGRESIVGDTYAVFEPSQAKSADLVTRDDDGNIIPLSERFNDKNEDIRYSLSANDSEGNTPKRRITQYSTGAYSGQTDMRMESYDGDKLAGYMEYSVYDDAPNIQYIHTEDEYRRQGVATEMLQKLQAEYPDAEINWGMTTPDGTKLFENATYPIIDKAVSQKKKRLETNKKKLAEIESEMNSLWKVADGRDFTEDERSKMQNLGEQWDKLHWNIKKAERDLEGAKEVRHMVKMPEDIRYSLSEKRNLQEENEKLKEAVWKKNEEMAYEKMASEIDLEKERRRRREAVKEIRTNKNATIEKIKQHHRDVEQAKRERRQESEERTKLLNIARRLDKVKTNTPTKQLINEFIGDLDLVAKKMTGKTLENLNELSEWYDEQRELDPFFSDSVIEKKINRISKKQIADMDINDVRDLTTILKSIEASIRNGNKFVESSYKHTMKEAGLETMKNINKSIGLKRNSALGKLDSFFINETLSPVRQIRRITGYVDDDPLYIATQELADGQRDMMTYEMNAWNMFTKFTEDKKFVESLNGKKARPIQLMAVKDGQTVLVKVTPDIAISLYLSCMNEDNLNHIGNGGVNIPDFELYRKGNLTEAYENSTRFTFSKEMLEMIESRLTTKEKALANTAYKYFNEVAPNAINRVSNILKGYDIATVKNYFPIMTDKNFLTHEFESLKFDATIEGQGSLKERVRSELPIEINGIVDTLTRSIKENSMYVGLAIPVRNMNKLLGVKDITWVEKDRGGKLANNLRMELHATYNGSVEESIRKKWGQPAMQYIENFMTDLQTSRTKRNDWVKTFNAARSNYAGAVLTFNASVAIKQAASYPTAAAVLGTAPLIRAMGDLGKVDLDLIAKYTPLQWYRSKGFSTPELGDIRAGRKGTLVDKATSIPALNWIQTMDILTTRKLWKASEYYVRQHSKSLEVGSDEYYKVVADIYNRVIEETQPNYAIMQRPALLRSDDSLVQTLNMFKTQPYQNFNILYDAIGNYIAKANEFKADKSEESRAAAKEAQREMQKAVTSQFMQLAVFAAMGFAWAFFRGRADKWKDEEEDKITINSFLQRLGIEMVGGSFAMLPFGADILYAMSPDGLFQDYYFEFSSTTDSAINDFLNTGRDMMSLVADVMSYATMEDKENYDPTALLRQIEKVIKEWGRFAGIPTDNLKKTYDAIYRWTMIAANGKYVGEYLAAKETLQKDSVKKMLLYKAYRHDPEQYELLRERMIEDGFDEDDLTSGLNNWLVKNMSKEETERFNESMDKIKGSTAWQEATDDEKKDYENKVKKYVLGISDSTTSPIENYAKENEVSYEEAITGYLDKKHTKEKQDSAVADSLEKLNASPEWKNASEDQQEYYKAVLREIITGDDSNRAEAVRSQAVNGKSVEDVLLESMRKEEESLNTVSSSDIWKNATEDDRASKELLLRKLALGIEDNETLSVTNKAVNGVTPEQVVLYKLALKKVDQPTASGKYGSYTNAEKQEAMALLLQEYGLTVEQQKTITGMK